jgi:hypothetical protein
VSLRLRGEFAPTRRVCAYAASLRLRGEFAPTRRVCIYAASLHLRSEFVSTRRVRAYTTVVPSSVGTYALVGAHTSFKKLSSEALEQGDWIGRIFTNWAIVYFGQYFETYNGF